jgi:hypothetical protein
MWEVQGVQRAQGYGCGYALRVLCDFYSVGVNV